MMFCSLFERNAVLLQSKNDTFKCCNGFLNISIHYKNVLTNSTKLKNNKNELKNLFLGENFVKRF